jgi:SAM-dependent methyltransferase
MLASNVTSHYTRGDLLERLNAVLRDDGVDPAHPTIETLAPYDQFHGRGMEATEELVAAMPAKATDLILDVGSGIGGPARYVATRWGCRVTGIDLTPEFGEVARHLTTVLGGLDGKVDFQTGDALAMPFADATFDGAYSMNVSMNIADKAGLYREIGRVLKPDAWLVLSELARGEGGDVDYPTPWARDASASSLSTPEATRQGLVAAGFDVVRLDNTLAKSLDYAGRSRAAVARGEKPPHRAVMLMHGDVAKPAMANVARALEDGRLIPIEVLARKRTP